MKRGSLLIVGKVPPPVGGIAVHVDRLLHYLQEDGFEPRFIELRVKNFFSLMNMLAGSKAFHLHSSNSKVKFVVMLMGKLLGARGVVTLHTDIDRHEGLDKWLERQIIKMADVPVVLNQNSLEKAKAINARAELISAFLPPYRLTNLPESYTDNIIELRRKTKKVYCTNASKLGFDKAGHEIYGILKLMGLFAINLDYGLVVSDSSGDYRRYCEENRIQLSKNILMISELHDFNAVIKQTDGMIRYTTVDGDAVSIKEALSSGKPVWASSVVSRPKEVVLVNSLSDLENKLFNQTFPESPSFTEDTLVKLIAIYKKYI